MKTLYVQNLSPRTTNDDVRIIFHQFGRVMNVEPVAPATDQQPFNSVCVQMASQDEALSARAALNGKDLNGLPLEILPPR